MDIAYTTPGPVASRFMLSNARRRIIKGPFGSGKTSTAVHEIPRRAAMQHRGPDGYRRTRWAVVRNTMPQLRDTTMKTWFSWFPNGSIGYYRETGRTFFIEMGDVRAEVLFRALDDEADVKNLLSLELTGAFFNEIREIPIALTDAMDGRIPRYPAVKDGGQTWCGMWGDTNPPIIDSDWYHVMEGFMPDGEPPDEGETNGWESFHQPSGLSPEAENYKNLSPNYYEELAKGKTEDFVNQYVHGEYGKSRAGKPVHPLFRRAVHVPQRPIIANPRVPLLLAFDFGLTPACVFKQQNAMGQVIALREFVSKSMGLQRMLKEKVLPVLAHDYRDFRVQVTGDPAGSRRSDADEMTCWKIIHNSGFKSWRPAESNSPIVRQGATDYFLGMLTEAGPAALYNPGCKYLIRGLEGGYHFPKRRKNGPEEEVSDAPAKNIFSHICEADQYGNMWYEGGQAAKQDARRRGGGLRPGGVKPGSYTKRS